MNEQNAIKISDKIDCILLEMTGNNEKINVSQVAKRLGLSNSAIYKFYPNKIQDIQIAQKKQKAKTEVISFGFENERLKKEIDNLKISNKEYMEIANNYKSQNEALWQHIQQVYRMYDEMLSERNGFAERLKFR